MVIFRNILLQPIPAMIAMIAIIAIPRYNNSRIAHPDPKKRAPKNPYFVRGGAEESSRPFATFPFSITEYFYYFRIHIFHVQSG